jgi:hypothetical protein
MDVYVETCLTKRSLIYEFLFCRIYMRKYYRQYSNSIHTEVEEGLINTVLLHNQSKINSTIKLKNEFVLVLYYYLH